MGIFSCRWDWCRSSFPSIDALDTHVKHDHIWPMKPMRKAEIALMRRMDLQSLHSPPRTDSSIISTGLTAGPRDETPPHQTHKHPGIEDFDTFTQLSSPPKTYSPQKLPVSPSLEGLVRQNGQSGLSAAVEMFERTHGHETNQRLRLPSHLRSPTHRPFSQSSGSSQEVVEQQLTQEDDVASQPLLPSNLPTEDELADPELKWPTDDELDVLATEEMPNLEQPASQQNFSLANSPRGQHFRCGSLNVPLDVNIYNANHPISSQASHASHGSQRTSQPLVLQTQAPYFSQATGWSQTQ